MSSFLKIMLKAKRMELNSIGNNGKIWRVWHGNANQIAIFGNEEEFNKSVNKDVCTDGTNWGILELRPSILGGDMILVNF